MMVQRSLATFLVAVASVAATGGNFTQSCSSFELCSGDTGHKDLLNATCIKMDNGAHNTILDLNLCLGIDQETAALIWLPYGKYTEYCSSCAMTGPAYIECSCTNLSGTINNTTTIDLDVGVENLNGSLSCSGEMIN